MTSLRILLVEDNPDLAANVIDYLEARGHAVDAAPDGAIGLRLAESGEYDVLVLDIVLPRLDGLALCRKLREGPRGHVPVLMLTARDSLDQKVAGFESGADDYVVKPFALRELEARLIALCRRALRATDQRVLRVADLSLDTHTWQVTRGERTISLPPTPLRLLETLMRASPRVLSRRELERVVWGDEPPDSDSLRAHLHLLRSGVDKPFERPLVHTLRGLGWQIADGERASQ